MLASTAVTRIKDGLAFNTDTDLDAKILLRIAEAQRDLEKGKTLPRFLLAEDQTSSLLINTHTVALPTRFIRMYDPEGPRFYASGSGAPTILAKRFLNEAQLAYLNTEQVTTTAAPKVYVVRNTVIDFIANADKAYTIYYSYWKGASLIAVGGDTNEWLADTAAPEWLIGEAGMRIAADARDGEAVQLFTKMRDMARAAWIAELYLDDDSGGPVAMGMDN